MHTHREALSVNVYTLKDEQRSPMRKMCGWQDGMDRMEGESNLRRGAEGT